MTSLLPQVPRLIFSVVEPISLIAGFCGAMVDPAWFIAQQIPESVGAGSIWPDAPPAVADPPVASDEGIMVAWQLGNLYLLMALMGVAILHSTSEVKVVRAYLFVLAVGDVGHVGLTAYGVGWDKFARPHEWNAMTMGNITFTTFLFTMRCLYFIGWFGSDQAHVSTGFGVSTPGKDKKKQ